MRDNKWRLWRFGLELLTSNQASPCFVLRVKSEEEAGGSIIAFSMTWLNATGDNVTSTNKTSGLNVISTTPVEAKIVASSLVNSPVVPMHLCKVLQIMTWNSKATRKTTTVIRYDMLVLINVSLEVMAVQSSLEQNHPAPPSIYTINPVPLHSCHLSMAIVCVVTNMFMSILLAAVKKCSGVQHENSLSTLLSSICTKINV